MLTKALIDKLTSVDTPTICNAIEVVKGGRQGSGFTRLPVVTDVPHLPPMLGYAKTAIIKAASPSERTAAENKVMRMAYYDYVVSEPHPSIVVIEDGDEIPLGAFWGELNVTIHQQLGLKGTLTNGAIRDLGTNPSDYNLIGGVVLPSHAYMRVEAINCPVTVFGLKINPNDLIHADRHGAVLIEPEILPELSRAIDLCLKKEAVVLNVARQSGFNVAKLKEAWNTMEGVVS
jgi:regulator of RNase E activity RraA